LTHVPCSRGDIVETLRQARRIACVADVADRPTVWGAAGTRCYETNAFRTDAGVHLFVPWIVGTFSSFSLSAISSSDIRLPSITLIFIRHV
jgi:hypothetical protein